MVCLKLEVALQSLLADFKLGQKSKASHCFFKVFGDLIQLNRPGNELTPRSRLRFLSSETF